jgi:acyl-CoA reductase-like NAD-dependent aldehyde dehydrogenase
MSAGVAPESHLLARNPSTGQVLATITATAPGAVEGLVARARVAQASWSRVKLKERLRAIDRWRGLLSRDAHVWVEALRDHVGKTPTEGMAEVIATLDALRWTSRNAAKALAPERLSRGWQRMLLVPPARLEWRPLGVVGILGTWNYPLFLTACPIADALAVGNAVAWKASESVPGIGERLDASLREAGLPDGLVAYLAGGPEVGQALCASAIDKGHFTGGVGAGRAVLASLAARGVSATAELSGFDPAIVLPDAPLEPTAKAIAWASFVNAGQTCIAIKRVIVVADDPRRWADALAAQARGLRVGDPAAAPVDVGPMISEAARSRFDSFVRHAVEAGAEVLAGGRAVAGPGFFYEPTVLLAPAGPTIADAIDRALAGCFGPIVTVRGAASEDAAVAAADGTDFGLAASVWCGRDRRRARGVASRLDAGMVAINDAVAPSSHAAAPFGGVKASGFGRTHGVAGLREFAATRVTHDRRPGGLRPQLYPYNTARTLRIMDFYRRLFHRAT